MMWSGFMRVIWLVAWLGLLVGFQPVSPAKGDDGVDKMNIGVNSSKDGAAPAKACVPVDFTSAALVRAEGRLLLRVSGQAPHPFLSIEVRPVQYVMQPDYWLMSLVACATPGGKLEGAPVSYAVEVNVSGYAGLKGIELSGKPGAKAKRLDLPA